MRIYVTQALMERKNARAPSQPKRRRSNESNIAEIQALHCNEARASDSNIPSFRSILKNSNNNTKNKDN